MGGVHFFQCAYCLFALYVYRENIQTASSPKLKARFQNNLAQLFLGWPLTYIVKIISIRKKTWPPVGGAYLPYMYIEKTLSNFFSKTTGQI